MSCSPVVAGGNFFTLEQVLDVTRTESTDEGVRIDGLVYFIDPGSGQVTCEECPVGAALRAQKSQQLDRKASR